jgi:hypothetical protein
LQAVNQGKDDAMKMRVPVVAMLVAVLCAMCTESNPLFEDPGTITACESAAAQLVIEPFNLADPDTVDILFVVDNSPGMAGAQTALSTAISSLVSRLNGVQGLDYHLGVISTDIVNPQERGALQTGVADQLGCPGDRPLFITRTTPASPDVARCNAVLGDRGDDFEAGLEAVRHAMLGAPSEEGGVNDGFFRNDARLVVILFSNEDDCSDDGSLARSDPNECEWNKDLLFSLTTYIGGDGFFDLIKSPRAGSPVDVVAIAGPPDGFVYDRPNPAEAVCHANGEAFHGERYGEVIAAMGSRGGFFSICNRSYEVVLERVLEEHIKARSEVVCAFLALTEPPIAVRVVDLDNESTVVPLSNDSDGYLYLGPIEGCPNGAIEISPNGHGGIGPNERIEIHYCTDDPLP